MSKISNVPQIRFKGFADDWEQRKFSEIALRESTVQESSRNFPSVEYEDVISEAGRLNKDVNQKEVVKKGIVFDGSQVLYGKLRPYLHNWLSPDFSGVAVGDWWVLKPIKVDKSFLYRLIQTQQFDYIANQSAGSKMPRADWNLVSNLEFAVPVSEDEQSKIGGYFSSLDTLITLHQRKYDQVVNFKKAMLEKMFPKDGSDIPEIRFKEFNQKDINAWEKKNFGDMVDFFSGLTYTPDDVKKEGTLVLRSSNVKNGEIVSADNVFVDPEVVNSKNVQSGDVIVVVRNGSRDLIGKHAQIKKDMPNTVIGAFMTGIRSERPDFISAILDTDIFDKEISKNMGATINQITGKMFMEMNFVIPSEEEQIKIGMFFRKLDDLILLYYQKLQNLKHIKKAVLEKMFV